MNAISPAQSPSQHPSRSISKGRRQTQHHSAGGRNKKGKNEILSYSFIDKGCYYDGTGKYRELFDRMRERFPVIPTKDNTCHYQNVLAAVASVYTYFHEQGVHPFVWFRMYSGMYALQDRVMDTLDNVLYEMYRMDESKLKHRLDMLLDIGIFYAYYQKSDTWLIDRLNIVGA